MDPRFDFANACSFPLILPGWRPPLTTWTVRNICYREFIDENDLLQATALAQRNQGGSGRVTFSVVLPSGSLEVEFPKLDPTSEMAWAPVQADAFPLTRVGIALHRDISSDAVISLAIASCVPIMISRRIDSDVSTIQVVYDELSMSHSKASWFLVNIRNALRSLHTQSCQSDHLHPLSLISPLYRCVLLTDNYLSRRLPSWFIFYSLMYFQSPRQCITLQGVQFITRAENRLTDGETAPLGRYRQDEEIAAPLHTFFLRWSKTDPLLVALRFFDCHQRIIEITYLDLHAISLHVAYALHSKGVQAGSLVPIALQHPADIIVSMLAVLQLGAAYVIMDTFNGDHMATLESTVPGVHLSPIALVEHPYQDEPGVRRGSTWYPRNEIQILLNTLKDENFLDDIDLSFLPGEIDPDAVAFYTSLFSPQGHFLTMTSFSHAEARRSLISFFKKDVISHGAKIFITPGNPPWLLHQIIWNMFKEGTTLCCDLRVQSSTTLSEHVSDSGCTHLIWSGDEPNRISLAEALSCPKGHSTRSATLKNIILPEGVLNTQEVESFPEGVELVECADCCTPG
ncbi:hypothetical protein FPV67DRAFT_1096837 [Lyophyllum atratum]|nr:hypothetical protein FPV67DRAFT_1096837 [Lyophyllum atratum]